MLRKIVLIAGAISFFSLVAEAKPRFPFPQTADQVGQNDRDLDDDVHGVEENLDSFRSDVSVATNTLSISTPAFSSSAAKIQSTTSTGTYCDQLGGASNGFECFVNGVLVVSFPGNGDFELYQSTANPGIFFQGLLSANKPILQARPTTNPWDLGSSTNKWSSLYLSSGIVGTTTNDSAPAGYAGEYISSSAVNTINVVTNNVFVNYVSMSLTAGDWDVRGEEDMESNGTGATALYGVISVNSANTTTDHVAGLNQVRALPNTVNIGFPLTIPPYRISISGTTTVYLKFAAGFSAGTPRVVQGGMSARRIR